MLRARESAVAVFLAAGSLALTICPGFGSASFCLVLVSMLNEATCNGSVCQGPWPRSPVRPAFFSQAAVVAAAAHPPKPLAHYLLIHVLGFFSKSPNHPWLN